MTVIRMFETSLETSSPTVARYQLHSLGVPMTTQTPPSLTANNFSSPWGTVSNNNIFVVGSRESSSDARPHTDDIVSSWCSDASIRLGVLCYSEYHHNTHVPSLVAVN
eukprot:8264191-Pyramimonas_sp.AAC.1